MKHIGSLLSLITALSVVSTEQVFAFVNVHEVVKIRGGSINRTTKSSISLSPSSTRSAHLTSRSATAAIEESNMGADSQIEQGVPGGFLSRIDLTLLGLFALFYAGNYGYSLTNKLAVKASAGLIPMTISMLNLGLGSLSYPPLLWMSKLRSRPPLLTWERHLKPLLPVALCTAGSHAASVYGYAHGTVSFVQIIKSAEPVVCAFVSQWLYRKPVSRAKWLTLPITIGGVLLASVKEVNFSWKALLSACIANLIAAIRSNETKKLMAHDDFAAMGPSNQFAITAMVGFGLLLPFAVLLESQHWGHFVSVLTDPNSDHKLRNNLVMASFYYYSYNELRTVTLKKTSAVTGSIANTLKRVIVIVGVALVLGEPLSTQKLLGTIIAVGGVFLYSIADVVDWGKQKVKAS